MVALNILIGYYLIYYIYKTNISVYITNEADLKL